MTDFSAQQVSWTTRLKEAFGSEVELEDEGGSSTVYEIIAEFEVQDNGYAVLRRADQPNGDLEFFKLDASSGELGLSTIDDDDEWENVSELYDELTFPADE